MCKVNMLPKKCFTNHKQSPRRAHRRPGTIWAGKKQRSPHCEHQKGFGAELNLMLWSIKHTHVQNPTEHLRNKSFWRLTIKYWRLSGHDYIKKFSCKRSGNPHMAQQYIFVAMTIAHTAGSPAPPNSKKIVFHFKNLSTNQSADLLAIATPPLCQATNQRPAVEDRYAGQ